MQTALIFLLFLGAVGYIVSRIYRAVSRKNAGCGKNCGCSSDAVPTQAVKRQTRTTA